MAIELRPLAPPPDAPVEVALAPLPVDADDFRLRHKTSDRAFYDDARAAAGAFEIIFRDAQGFLTEGSFTNLFVERGGRLVTPPLARGLLPGVLRARLLDEGRAVEGDLRPADLAGGFFLGNAVRGLVPARLRSRDGIDGAMQMDRRAFLAFGGAAMVVGVAVTYPGGEPPADATPPPPGRFPFRLTDAQWRARLSGLQYRVLRQGETERAGTSPLNNEHRRGTFHCAGCNQPLFSLDDQVRQRHRLAELLAAAAPRGGGRGRTTASACAAPKSSAPAAAAISATSSPTARRPTGLRYCMNGVAMTFRCWHDRGQLPVTVPVQAAIGKRSSRSCTGTSASAPLADRADDLGMMGVEPAGQRAEGGQDQLALRRHEAAPRDQPAAQVQAQLGVEMAGQFGPRLVRARPRGAAAARPPPPRRRSRRRNGRQSRGRDCR